MVNLSVISKVRTYRKKKVNQKIIKHIQAEQKVSNKAKLVDPSAANAFWQSTFSLKLLQFILSYTF